MVAGTRVIDRVANVLRAVTGDLLLVANDDAADAWLPGVLRIADVRRGVGPLGGVHAALAHTGGDIVAVAWDMPFVTPALLHELRQRARPPSVAVVPESADGRLEPTCAYYAAAAKARIERWLDSGRQGAGAFLEQCPDVERVSTAEVEPFGDPARLFFSINTPAALAEAEALAAHS